MNNKLMETIKKLLTHSESAAQIGNQAEAAAFMNKVNKLTLKHKISLAEVNTFDPNNTDDSIQSDMVDYIEHGLPELRRAAKYVWDLARVIAYANNCRHLVMTGSNNIWFCGRSSDREIAAHMFVIAYRTLLTDCVTEYRKADANARRLGQRSEMMAGWRNSFREGFVYAIWNRLEESREEMKKTTTPETFALVTTNQLVAVNNYMEKYTGRARGLSGSRSNNEYGSRAGKASGNNCSLSGGAINGGSTKQLTN